MSGLTELEERASATVDRMCHAWHALDPDEVIALFTPDGTMQSMMMEPYRGHAEIRAMLEAFFAYATDVEMKVINRCVRGNIVMLERLDHFTANGQSCALPAVGVFEVEGTKVRSWREYFDWATFERQIA